VLLRGICRSEQGAWWWQRAAG